MTDITAADLIAAFRAIAGTIEAHADHLSQLDGVIGDADHGVTMKIGFVAVTEALGELDPAETDPAAVFVAAARSFLNAVGASSGPLYATAFIRAGASVKGRATLDRDGMVEAIAAMAQGIQDRGKAAPGEKTMVDAWAPAAEAARAARAQDHDLGACLAAAAAAAAQGAEATKAMRATKGRAARLGDRVIGHADPGATSTALILAALAETLGQQSA